MKALRVAVQQVRRLPRTVTAVTRPTRAKSRPANPGEVELDFTREWVEFYDPDNPEHLIAADMTGCCRTGHACLAHRHAAARWPDGPNDGCCSHGAFLTDNDDRAQLDDAVTKLSDKDWQFREKGLGPKGYLET